MPSPERAPFLTVLLVAHAGGRRDFLREAIESLAHQTLPRERFEVCFVRDFHDPAVDARARELGFVDVMTPPGPAAEKTLAGFRAGRGEVFTFLDYDDLCDPQRLQVVHDAFSTDPKLGYLHDGIRCIDEEGNPSHRGLPPVFRMMEFSRRRETVTDEQKSHRSPRLGFARPDFHGISLRRPVVEYVLPYLERVRGSVDTLLYSAAWTLPLSVRVEPRHLYLYRVHSTNSSLSTGSTPEETARQREAWRRQTRADYQIILEMIARGGRVELRRDQEFRLFSEGVFSALRDPRCGRREVWEACSEFPRHAHRTNLSPLFVQTLLVAAAGMGMPSLARRFAGAGM